MKFKSFEKSEDILKISPGNAGELFISKTQSDLKEEYRRLCSKWHPDKNIKGEDTTAVFAHLKVLYESFSKSLSSNFVVFSKNMLITDRDGKTFDISFRRRKVSELGDVFLGREIIAYKVDDDYMDLYEDGLKTINNLNFANKKMEKEIMKYLPIISQDIRGDVNLVVFKKAKDSIFLVDLLNHFGGKLDPRHVAWILSSMYNMACFFQYNKIVYGGFTIEDYLVNPQEHLGCTTSFWFSKKQGEKLSALSSKAVNVAPLSIINTKKADIGLDLEMIRLVGRELLGDKVGIKLAKDKSIPKPMVDWLRSSSTGDAIKDYKIWHEDVLIRSFGVRRFTEMGIKFNDVYN